MSYAKTTSVSPEKSLGDIKKCLSKAGSSSFAHIEKGNQAMIMFEFKSMAVKIKLKLPLKLENSVKAEKAHDQKVRTAYRALLLCVKAKVEAVEAGIETFEQAFLPHIVLKNGDLVGDRIIPKLEELNHGHASLMLGL